MRTCRAARIWGLTLLFGGPAAASEGAAPEPPRWSLDTFRGLLEEVGGAGRFEDVAQKDAALARAMARAYGVAPGAGASTPRLAARALAARRPDHPQVQSGQELLALARQFYADVAHRAAALARFEKNRKIRAWLEARAAEGRQAAGTLAAELQVEAPGLEGFLGLPPEVSGGVAPGVAGARAEVVGPKLVIERLPRATFRGAEAEPGAPRTRGGALREVRAALKQFDTTASMLGRYDPSWRKRRGRVHFVAPASAPAAYLRELVVAARDVGFKTVSVVVLDPRGQVRVLPLAMRRKKGSVPVSCPPELPMQDCAERISRARSRGRAVLAL
ncbi:MAG: hypothetical protein AAFU79_22720 [Myxococcota bacterium]